MFIKYGQELNDWIDEELSRASFWHKVKISKLTPPKRKEESPRMMRSAPQISTRSGIHFFQKPTPRLKRTIQSNKEGAQYEQLFGWAKEKAAHYLKREDDIVEVAHEATEEVIARIDDINNPRNYVKTVARNKAQYRAKQMKMTDVQVDPDRITTESPEESYIQQEKQIAEESLRELLYEAIDQLLPNQASVLRLRIYAGMSYKDIALELGMTHSAVDGLLERARKNVSKYVLKMAHPHLVNGL